MSKEKETGAAAAAPSLEEINATLSAQVADYKSALATAAEKNAKLEDEVQTLKSELKDAAEVIADLKDQLKEGGKAKGPVGKVGKNKYRILGAFKKAGKTITAEDIAADENILKALVAGNSTLIELITD